MTPIGIALLLAVIILGGSAAYLYLKAHKKVETPLPAEPVATTTPVVTDPTAGWVTYTATSTYGFSIKYPLELATTSAFAAHQHVTSGWRQEAGNEVKGKTTGDRIISVIVDSKKNAPEEEGYYVAVEVRIGASSNANAVKRCLEKADDEDNGVAALLGGTPFTRFDRVSAGMSQFGNVSSYRAVKEGQCFAIESIVAGGGTNPGDPSHDAALLDADQKLAEAIVETFRFVE